MQLSGARIAVQQYWPRGTVVALSAVLVLVMELAFGPQVARLRDEPLPDFWPAPRFQLIDQQGRSFGSDELAGRAALFSFIYTNCTDTCPLLTAIMAQSRENSVQTACSVQKSRSSR